MPGWTIYFSSVTALYLGDQMSRWPNVLMVLSLIVIVAKSSWWKVCVVQCLIAYCELSKCQVVKWCSTFALFVKELGGGGTVECPYNTKCDDKISATHFLVPFCILISIFFLKFFWTFFFMSGNFLTPANHKGPPLWWKIWKVVQKQFLIALKKRLDALNATQKITAPVSEKNQEKPVDS